jgi:hypothetical protein
LSLYEYPPVDPVDAGFGAGFWSDSVVESGIVALGSRPHPVQGV